MSILDEAEAFDSIIKERIENGHIPDLQRVQPCDYFYNNPWRRPYLANLVFGGCLDFIKSRASGKSVLEIGSGSGYMSLELARNGFDVTGLDLSPASVKIAQSIASENPYKDNFGSLKYISQDFLTWESGAKFDNICFIGVLHHFSNIDEILAKVKKSLASEGRVFVCEPARDWLTKKDASVIALIRILLSSYGGWYEELSIPKDAAELENYIESCLLEYQEARDLHEPVQSPHDNAADASSILESLCSNFSQIKLEPNSSFFPRICGGIRSENEEKNKQLAEFLLLFDRFATDLGLINPGGFMWVGQNK